MSICYFTRRDTNEEIAQHIRQKTHGDPTFKFSNDAIHGFAFYEITFDQQLASAVINYFQSSVSKKIITNEPKDHQLLYQKQVDRKVNNPGFLLEFSLYSCPGNNYLDQVLRSAIELDVVQHYRIRGDSNFDSIQESRNPNGTGQEQRQQPLRRVRRWMSIPPSERPLELQQYVQPSLQPFGGCQNKIGNGNVKSDTNLRGFSLSHFRVTREDMKLLREVILSSRSGGLETLSFVNVAFLEDEAVHELSESLALLSQQMQLNQNQDIDHNSKIARDLSTGLSASRKYLRELSLVRCDLTDEQLELVVRSLMTTTIRNNCGTLPSPSHGIMKSSLSKLNISSNRCGELSLKALGTWLLNLDSKSTPNALCSCSLESLEISNNIENDNIDTLSNSLQLRSWTQLMENKGDQGNYDETATDIALAVDSSKLRTNKTLKQLRLNGNTHLGGRNEEGVVNLECLGRFVSNCLVGLKELDLDSSGVTDDGFARFAGASHILPCSVTLDKATSSKSSSITSKAGSLISSASPNISLRLLRLSGNYEISSRSAQAMVEVLNRYPMLKSITFGCYKKQNVWKRTIHEKQIRHLLTINESGRVLLFSSGNHEKYPSGEFVPLSLWAVVLERINRRFWNNAWSKDSQIQAADAIFFLIRRNITIAIQRSKHDSGRTTAVISSPSDIEPGNTKDDASVGTQCPQLRLATNGNKRTRDCNAETRDFKRKSQ